MIKRFQLSSFIRCYFSITTRRLQCTSVSSVLPPTMEATQSASPPPPQNHSSAKMEADEHPRPTLGTPIGYIKSCFKSKNGTPRQPTVCTFSRAKLRILKEAFPNPEHSIQGLDKFSHVWILFVFHKNGGGKFTKAKVKPPRLDGKKVGVFSTRSPHRPNPIGLTLAKLDRIQGDTLHLSGVDIIEGTPVLDIKPYVPSYDNPYSIQRGQTSSDQGRLQISPGTLLFTSTPGTTLKAESNLNHHHGSSVDGCGELDQTVNLQNADVDASVAPKNEEVVNAGIECMPEHLDSVCKSSSSGSTDCKKPHEKKPQTSSDTQKHFDGSQNTTQATHSENRTRSQFVHEADDCSDALLPSHRDEYSSPGSKVAVADWIKHPPINKLTVRFTEHAQADLRQFHASSIDGDYRLEFLQSQQEARRAICEILEADPRSTYRRNNCQDRLYFFTVDTLHITCWFGGDFVEVVRVQPVSFADVPKQ